MGEKKLTNQLAVETATNEDYEYYMEKQAERRREEEKLNELNDYEEEMYELGMEEEMKMSDAEYLVRCMNLPF